jgi:hypothetical protein
MVKRGMNKTGQFYLIAAIILAAIIIGIITVSNYSKKEMSFEVYDLKEELQIESENVIDYGIYNEFSQTEMHELLDNFVQIYIDSESNDKDLYFVFGNENNMTLKGFQKSNQTVRLNNAIITTSPGAFVGGINPVGDLKVLIAENTYDFKLESGENFYFIIFQKIGGDEYVVTG